MATEYEHNGYKVVAFTDTGEHSWTVPSKAYKGKVDVLIVAGGGAGGYCGDMATAGGGGAGGLRFIKDHAVSSGSTINVNVGSGGKAKSDSAGENGENSDFDSIVADGGGGGGGANGDLAKDGGSGGGGEASEGSSKAKGGSGTSGQGHDGGDGDPSGYGGGGGGGAGEPGVDASGNSAGRGGDGLKEATVDGTTYTFSELFGTDYGEIIDGEAWFAGGGGGGGRDDFSDSEGGKGGGGAGEYRDDDSEFSAGDPNTGGGGGGPYWAGNMGKDGGSGIVLVRYKETIVYSDSPTDITRDSATLNGTLDDLDGNSSLDVYFEWGTDTDYGNTTSTQTLSSTSSFSEDISGLDTLQKYHYRSVATDGTDTWYGEDAKFTTSDLQKVEETKSDWEDGSLTDTVIENDNLKLDVEEVEEVIESFTDTGSHTWEVPDGVKEVDVLVVAGGGAGAGGPRNCSSGYGGGGGAGGLVYKSGLSVNPGESIDITVGDGGPYLEDRGEHADPGEDSEAFGLIAKGGGPAPNARYSIIESNAPDGGSTGGATTCFIGGEADNIGNAIQSGTNSDVDEDAGNDGGVLLGGDRDGPGGGGGGASEEGKTDQDGGHGGDGLYFGDIFGDEYGDDGYFAGGGGGGHRGSSPGSGGKGGGAKGAAKKDASNPMPNTGGGGGGSYNSGSGSGGASGIVLIRYKTGALGTRTSPQLDLSSIEKVKNTLIEWDSDEPTDTSIKIETRYSSDNGDSWSDWEEVSNGGTIPGIAGEDTSSTLLECRQTLTTDDEAITPKLHFLGLYLVEEYVVATRIPSDVTTSTATLNGSLGSLEGNSSLDVHFEWGTDDSYGNTTSTQALDDTGDFSDSISELTEGTTYHYRAVATDGTDTWYGSDVTFTVEDEEVVITFKQFFMFGF